MSRLRPRAAFVVSAFADAATRSRTVAGGARGVRLAASVLAAAGMGWLIFHLWGTLGLPSRGGPLDAPFPGLWRWFFAIWFPLLFPAFTLVHELLARHGEVGGLSAPVTRAALAWDRRSYALLAFFVPVMAAWKPIGDWRLALGALFVGALFVKTLGVVITLYRGYFLASRAADDRSDPAWLPGQLFLAAFLLYGFLAPYVVTAVSTTGDEHLYLLHTASLYTDGDLDITNNVERRDYEKFYWARRPGPLRWKAHFVAFPTLLLPGYAAAAAALPYYPPAGRLGATLVIALFAALLSVQVYRLCRELGVSRPAAFWGWAVVALTPPVVVGAGHVYPEIPAACAAVVGVRALRRIPSRTWSGLALAAGAAAFMTLLKRRYAPLSLGLLFWALARLTARRTLLAGTLVLGILVVGIYALVADPLPVPLAGLLKGRRLPVGGLTWNRHMTVALLALLVDQQFGLFYYGPHWMLTLPGMVLLWRRSREAWLGLVGLTAFYVLVVVQYRWIQWDAGFTPPPRFILAAAPLLVPFVAEAFDRCRGRGLAAANTLWLVWSAVVVFLVSLVPFWRYESLTGRSTLLQLAGTQLGLDFARFVPTLRAPTAWTWTSLALGGLLLLAVSLGCVRRREGGSQGWGTGAVLLPPIPAVGLVLAVVALWVSLAAVVPTWSVEAEAMWHSGGVPYGAYTIQEALWVMKADAELSERIVTWPGVTEITVSAGGRSTTGVAPRMTLRLDGQPVASWPLEAGQAWWAESAYVARVPTRFGHPVLSLQLTDLLDEPGRSPGRAQHAYVDRIRLKWISGAP